MKILSRIGKGMLALVAVIMLVLVARGLMDAKVDYDVSTAGVSIPNYTTV
jgi:hypothetical protein